MIYPIPNPKLHELFWGFFFIWHWSVTLENGGLILYFQGILSGNYPVINRNIKCHAIIFHRLADFRSHINRLGKNCPRCDVQKALSIYEIIGRSFNATYWQNNHVSFSHFLLVIKIDPNKTNHLHIIITLYGVIKHPLLVCPSAHVNGFKNLEFAQTQLKKGSSLYKKNPHI